MDLIYIIYLHNNYNSCIMYIEISVYYTLWFLCILYIYINIHINI